MKRTHLDLVDYLFPTVVFTAIFSFLILALTGGFIPNTDCSENLSFYGRQLTNYYSSENANDYPLPSGYWIEENTQRVVKLRAWDGSWARWSYGGNSELSSDTGWFSVFSTILSTVLCLVLGGIAGFLTSLLLPRKVIELFYA